MKDWIPVIMFGLMISAITLGLVQVAQATVTTAILLLLFRCTTFNDAKDSIKWDVLFIIGGAFGIAEAMIKTGAAQYISNAIILSFDHLSPILLLIIIYVITNILTELITNNAAAVIMFPIGMSFVHELSLNPEPYAVAIAIAASASFSTPIGYQTNLLVYSTGQYRFNEFVKVGIPLNILGLLISILIIPFVWPFQ